MDTVCEAVLYQTAFLLMEEAQEGTNIDAIGMWVARLKEVPDIKRDMKAAEKRGDFTTAAEKADQIVQYFVDLDAKIGSLPDSLRSRIIINIAIILAECLLECVIDNFDAARGRDIIDRKNEELLHTRSKLFDQRSAEPNFNANVFHMETNRLVNDLTDRWYEKLRKITNLKKWGMKLATIAVLLKPNFTKKPEDEELSHNDRNLLIQAIRADCKRGQRIFTEKAEKYRNQMRAAVFEREATEALYLNNAFLMMEEAQEGANIQAAGAWIARLRDVHKLKSEMKRLAKKKDYENAAAKADEIVQYFIDLDSNIQALHVTNTSTILVNIALLLVVIIAEDVVFQKTTDLLYTGYKKLSKPITDQMDEIDDSTLFRSVGEPSDEARYNELSKKHDQLYSIYKKVFHGNKWLSKAGSVLAVWKFLTSIGFTKNPEVAAENMTDADRNRLIQAIRADCRRGREKYQQKAQEYRTAAHPDPFDAVTESWFYDIADDLIEIAQEGTNIDAIGAFVANTKKLNAVKREMNAAEKAGDYKTAGAKAEECLHMLNDLAAHVNCLNDSKSSKVIVDIVLILVVVISAAVGFGVGYGVQKLHYRKTERANRNFIHNVEHSPVLNLTPGDVNSITGLSRLNLAEIGKRKRNAGIIGAAVGGLSTLAYLARKGFKTRKDIEKADLSENDKNRLIQAIRADCKYGAQLYRKKIDQYKRMDNRANATESWLMG